MTSTAEALPPVDRPTNLRHLVLAALLAITAINYIQRNCIAPAATTIQPDLGLTRDDMGDILAAFFLSYTFLQVPSGATAQALGAKWALILFSVGWSLALAATAWADGYWGLYVGRLALGALQAGIFPCATLILAVWYPVTKRGLATALLNSFMVIGGAVGTALTGRLLGPLGWRTLFVGFAVPGVLWAVWFAWWFRRRPEEDPRVNAAELAMIRHVPAPTEVPPVPVSADPPRSRAAVLTTMAILMLVLLYTQQAFRAGANRLFDNWMPTYYEEARGLTREDAADLTAVLQIALVVGGLVGGMLSDYVLARTGSRWAARNGVAMFSLISACVFYLAAYPIENVYLATLVFGIGAFLFTFSSPCAYALTIDVGGRYLAIIFGLMNMIGNLGAWAFVKYLPRIQAFGGWDLALGTFVAMQLAALVCWLFLNPNIVIGEPSRQE